MPKSRKRGGEKAHRKRIKLRIIKMKQQITHASKQAWDKFEEWKKQKGEDTNNESI